MDNPGSSARKGKHDSTEYVLPMVSKLFLEVNFGMCFEHKGNLGSARRKRV